MYIGTQGVSDKFSLFPTCNNVEGGLALYKRMNGC